MSTMKLTVATAADAAPSPPPPPPPAASPAPSTCSPCSCCCFVGCCYLSSSLFTKHNLATTWHCQRWTREGGLVKAFSYGSARSHFVAGAALGRLLKSHSLTLGAAQSQVASQSTLLFSCSVSVPPLWLSSKRLARPLTPPSCPFSARCLYY